MLPKSKVYEFKGKKKTNKKTEKRGKHFFERNKFWKESEKCD